MEELTSEEIKKNKQRERARKSMAKLRERDPELARLKARKSMAKLREQDPELANAKTRKWKQQHSDRARELAENWKQMNPDYQKNYYQKWKEEKGEITNAKRRESRKQKKLEKDAQLLSEQNADLVNSNISTVLEKIKHPDEHSFSERKRRKTQKVSALKQIENLDAQEIGQLEEFDGGRKPRKCRNRKTSKRRARK